ncbi:MAG: hypothetical protein PHX60_07060 [Giesbergeria sp.]|uniref:hypothetical protein n=1 Tax=Giesbergeria sp. TaxID=2818473 RepID=UPI00261AB28D|nr:hypothetical protein [Giesbergeria sp.]MDD2609445.1 hypothetical protein [Giesbergeria sp.]
MSIDLLYGYYTNLDERGMFYADVRDSSGTTVFEIRVGDNLLDENSDFEDYSMKNKQDVSGLEKFLKDCQIIKSTGMLLNFSEFERRLDAPSSAWSDED